MPLYEYECIHCHRLLEVRASIREKIAGLTPRCPICGGEEVKQRLTAGTVLRGGNGSSNMGCGPNSGPGCCR